jgi:hypothetical protein
MTRSSRLPEEEKEEAKSHMTTPVTAIDPLSSFSSPTLNEILIEIRKLKEEVAILRDSVEQVKIYVLNGWNI